ncbi:acyltransferase domain-containing protein [Limnobacter sp.]|uniref:acyltransferase domain-containing protein n=1 Tax=Limnobacter sp. TaxID=2003368 RepID=UPI0035159CC8
MSLCLLCPGQGSQSTDMLTALLADPLVAPSLQALMGGQTEHWLAVAANPQTAFENQHAQPLIVMAGLAVAQALQGQGICPGLAAGYSVGELTAQGVVGALPAHICVALAQTRAQSMDQASPSGHGMMAVKGVRLPVLQAEVEQHGLRIAIVNDEQHAVVAGPVKVMKQICQGLQARLGAHVVHLPVHVPSHTAWLANATAQFEQTLQQAAWQSFEAPVLSALDGSPVHSQTEAVPRLARQISEPLQWSRTLDLSAEMGASVYFEVGPGNTLTRMVRERFPNVAARSITEFQTLAGAVAWLQQHVA